jgi:thiol-disulfide isomerase/thioredoxin
MLPGRHQSFRLHRLDRLPALIPLVFLSVLLGWSGCGRQAEEAPQMSRVAAVKAKPGNTDPGRLCDSFHPGDTAPRLELPPLEPARPGESLPAVPQDRWLWINLWATWCGPCRREMPLIEAWRGQLEKEGVAVQVWYLSVDEDAGELARFLRQNPRVAAGYSLRLKEMRYLEPWLKAYGLGSASAIPIHLVVAPGGKVRCAHVGELREGDYPLMKELLR